MKVLHINGNYLSTKLHYLMIDGIGELSVNNWIYVPVFANKDAADYLDNNVTVSKCFKKNDRFVFHYKQAKIIKDIDNKIDVASYDLIHAYTLFTDGNCARFLAKKYGVPYVVAVRNTDLNVFFKYRFYLRKRGISILSDAARVFFLSDSYYDETIRKYVPKKYQENIIKKSIVIPNGIDDYWLDNKNYEKKFQLCESNEIKLIYAGAINKNKNILLTKKALDCLNKRGINASLTVIGKVLDKSVYEKLKSDSRITVKKAMPKEELITEYRKADIFVMPSFTETFGLVYPEAMSQGLPVIYSKGQGFDNQFPDGEVGFHIDSKSPDECADAICKIVDNYQIISKNCIERSELFRWSEICKRYLNVYNDVLSQH